jgi:hypothetical protein
MIMNDKRSWILDIFFEPELSLLIFLANPFIRLRIMPAFLSHWRKTLFATETIKARNEKKTTTLARCFI